MHKKLLKNFANSKKGVIFASSNLKTTTATMKPIQCRLYGFTRWGYNFAPIHCKSIKEAKEIAKKNEDSGYWFSHIIEKLN